LEPNGAAERGGRRTRHGREAGDVAAPRKSSMAATQMRRGSASQSMVPGGDGSGGRETSNSGNADEGGHETEHGEGEEASGARN